MSRLFRCFPLLHVLSQRTVGRHLYDQKPTRVRRSNPSEGSSFRPNDGEASDHGGPIMCLRGYIKRRHSQAWAGSMLSRTNFVDIEAVRCATRWR
jgi:hypothetical protein